MAVAIPEHSRGALHDHLLQYGVTDDGLDIIFVVEANGAYPFEVFYSWVTFPAADGTSGFFHSYTATALPVAYQPYRTLEIPISAWQHTIWFNGALPHPVTSVRMGPLSIDGATWPVLAGFTPHPNYLRVTVEQLRVLYSSVVTVYRALVRYVTRAAQPLQGAVHPQGTVVPVGISPIMVNSVMGKRPEDKDDLPYWLAEKFDQLEAVFPHTSPVEKQRILTISLPKDLTPDVRDCQTWGKIFASVYSKCFGTPSMSVLPTVIKRVQDQHGAEAAVELGMRLVGVFDVVADLILANIKGDAVSFQVANGLALIPDADKARELPRIIAEAYKTVGRNSLGNKPFARVQGQVVKTPTDESAKPVFPKKNWKNKKQGQQKQYDQGSRAPSPAPDPQERSYDLRDRSKIKATERFTVPDTRSPRPSQETSASQAGGSGRQDRGRGPTDTGSRDTKSQPTDFPRFRQSFQKKTVAALTADYATDSSDQTPGLDMGGNAVRQRRGSHHSEGESASQYGGESN